jgi:SAM-dependent methyltransferase
MTIPKPVKRVGQFVRHLDRYVLRRVFGFDLWHVNRLRDRPYAMAVIAYLNGLPESRRGTIVEIGCGMGDIIRRVRFRERLGLDADPSVLSAARFLAHLRFASHLRFEAHRFPRDPLAGRFDAVIMVNWPHMVDADTLQPALFACVRDHLTPGGVLIVDTVQDRTYRYNHSIDRLAPGGSVVTKLGEFDRQRELWAIAGQSDR